MEENSLPRIIQLPKILDKRGNLSFIEYPGQLPFRIKRTYWIYDVPGGECRGEHAFRTQQEFIIALSGSFDVTLHDGLKETVYSFNRSFYGLFVPKMHWRKITNFSTNALVLILTDAFFDESDYIRNFEQFKLEKNG